MKADMALFNWRGCGEMREGQKYLQMLKVERDF
jgi:hypothetical protein